MNSLIFTALVAGSAAAAIIDARTGRIPNWLTLATAVVGMGGHVAVGGVWGAVESGLGLVLGGLVPWAMHRCTRGKAIGGGDVKLFAALGAVGGPMLGLQIQLSSFVLLAVFAVLRLAFQGALLRVLGNALRLSLRPVLPARWRPMVAAEALTEMRMGPAIAAGVVVVLLRDQLAGWLPWIV